mgnify:CR=1 FL=1
MPSISKKDRSTYKTKARQSYIKDKAKAFTGMDKSNASFYNSRTWRKLRLMILNKQPVCKMCEDKGKVTSSTVVDHIIPINKGGAKLNPDNLQGLCFRCHSIKSSKDK